MEEKSNVNYLNYYQYNTPENALQFLDAKFRQAQNDGLRMIYDVSKGIGSIFVNKDTEEEWEKFSEELRTRNEQTEFNLAKYKAGNGVVKNFALDFTGMAIRSFGTPFDVATGGLGVGAGITANVGQYIYDEYSLYKRNVFKDFKGEDAVNILASAATTLGFAKLTSNIPKVEGGEFLYKENLKNLNYSETRIDKMSNEQRQILEMLHSYGIYDDNKKIISNIKEVQDTFNKMYDLAPGSPELKDISKRLKELDPYVQLLSKHEEFFNITKKAGETATDRITPKEFFEGFTEVKTNYKDFNKTSLEATANTVLNEIGVNPNEVSNIKVRASTIRTKYASATGLDSYGEVKFERNKYVKNGEEVRTVFEKNGDLYLVKSFIDENPAMNVDNHKVFRLGDVAPMDKLTDGVISEETQALKNIKRMGYTNLIDMKNYNEVLQRRRYDRPQSNYTNSIINDYNNAVSYLDDLSKVYKEESSKNYLKTGKRDTNIEVPYNTIDAVQPIYKNMKMNLEQKMGDDAQELFNSTDGIVKPFGNYLYDYVNEDLKMNNTEFVYRMQSKDFSGENGKFLKTFNTKVNEYLQNRSGSSKEIDVKEAYYLDLMFDKQKTMIGIKNALDDGVDGNFEKINEISKLIGDKVYLTEKEAKAVGLNWDNGKQSIKRKLQFNEKLQDVELKEYSIKENPLEVTKSLWYALESSTQGSKKRGGGSWDYQTTYQVGKRFANNNDYGNFAALFSGNEREIYDIVSEVYSTNAKYSIGLDQLDNIIENLRADSREFNYTVARKNIPGLKTMDQRYRAEAIKQLEGMRSKLNIDGLYKPNFTTDPETLRLNNGAIRRSIKSYMGFKFLGNLNYIREFPVNNLKNIYGARKLGWNVKYGFLKSTVLDPIKVNYDLFAHCKKAKKGLLDTITDPVAKRRVELFLETRVANDPIYNNPKNFNNKVLKTVDTLGKNLAVGQTVSDIHRKVNAEYMSINFLKDIFPNLKEMTTTLKSVLKSNGIGDVELDDIRTRLSGINDKELMDLVWNGKKAANPTDYKIQSLFNQFSDIMGREFQAFQDLKPKGETLKGGIVEDMLYLYKRYSLGALDNFTRNLTTYRDIDGIVRSRFSKLGDSDWTTRLKGTFTGTNIDNVLDFGKAAVGTSLLYTGIRWTHGKLSGSSEDERAEAKFEALFKEKAVVSLAWESVQDFIMDYTGIGIVLGSKTVAGGFMDSTIARFNRALGDTENPLSKPERLLWWFAASFLTPESISRGIDNIKLNKSIPTRITSPSEAENELWNNKYSVLAEIDQLERKLPLEKGFGKIVDWVDFFKKNPEKAYQVTGSPKKADKNAVIAGASAITETIEEYSELTSLEEIFREQDPTIKQKQLEILGLDVDSQLKQMRAIDRRTLNAILSFKGIRDEREIILIMQQLNHADNKKEFLRDMLSDQELPAFRVFSKNLKTNKEQINAKIRRLKGKKGIENYVEFLETLQ